MRLRLTVLGATAALLSVSAFTTASASTGSSVTFSRWQGPDRYGTAAALAEAAYPGGAANVVVASGASYADALAAGYLSGYLHGPILLTDPKALPTVTSHALMALGAHHVHLVGGASAISPTVAASLASLPAAGAGRMTVSRIAGATRYDTAADVAELPPPSAVGVVGGLRTAIVASGANFPDALAGSPLAAGAALPILLTDPAALSKQVSSALVHLGVKQVLVLGGPVALSPSIDSTLSAMGITVHRLFGPDRGATAAAIARWATSTAGFTPTRVAVARGDAAGGGVDALAVGPLAGVKREPLLLTDSATSAGSSTLGYMKAVGPQVVGGDVAGGPGAVSPALQAQLEAFATGGSKPSGTASLHIAVTDLPNGTAAAVTVTGPGGFARTVTASTDLTGLAAGDYRIAAASVTAGDGTTYVPTVNGPDQNLGTGSSASAVVDYFTQIPATTKAVDPSRIVSVTPNADGTTTVVTSAGAPAAAVGDVIAAGIGTVTPDGLLVKVTSSAPDGPGQSLITVPATLQDAITRGDLNASTALPSQSPDATATNATTTAAVGRAAASPSGWSRNLACNASATLSLTGSLTASLTPEFQARWTPTDVSASATLTSELESQMDMNLSGAASCTLKPTPLGPERTLSPWVFDIGFIPVVIVPRLQFTVQGSASAQGSYTVGADVQVRSAAGLSYDDGTLTPTGTFTPTATFTWPDFTADSGSEIAASISGQLTLALYGIDGPVLNIDPGLDLKEGVFDGIPGWMLYGTVKAGASLVVKKLGINASNDHLIDKSFLIKQAEGF